MLAPPKHENERIVEIKRVPWYLAPHLPSPARYATFPRNHPDGGV